MAHEHHILKGQLPAASHDPRLLRCGRDLTIRSCTTGRISIPLRALLGPVAY
jgi:hypothetical protein